MPVLKSWYKRNIRKAISGLLIFLMLFSMLPAGAMAAEVIPVNGAATVVEAAEGRRIFVPDHHPTIQGAVNAASPGDTIVVREGTYTENIDVTKRLTIKSEQGPDATIVRAARSDDHVFHVKADHVTISGFTIRGATVDRRGGIALESANHSEIYNNISLGNWVGIGLFVSHNNIIRNNTLSNNRYGIGMTEDTRACAAETAVYGTEITTTPEGILHSLRNLRDREINPEHVNLFYQYSPEVTRILVEEPALLLESARLLRKYMPALRYVLGEGGENKEITGEDVIRVVLFINNLIDEISVREANMGTAQASALIKLLEEFAGQVEASQDQRFSQAFQNSVYFIGNKETIAPLSGGGSNIIYLNNLVGNTSNVRIERATATWRSPAPITYIFNGQTFTSHLGNYWSGYAGRDADGNGIGDTPHAVDNGDRDPFPLMTRFENYVPYVLRPEPEPNMPVAHFTISIKNPIIHQSIMFDASASLEPDDKIISHTWDFGDGTRRSGIRVSHAYRAAGNFPVTLTVTNTQNETANKERIITIVDPARPVITAVTPEITGIALEGISFENTYTAQIASKTAINRVIFRIGEREYIDNYAGDGWSKRIDIGLLEGDTRLEVIAEDIKGIKSESHSTVIRIRGIPEWLTQLIKIGKVEISEEGRIEISKEVLPKVDVSLDIPDKIPVFGKMDPAFRSGFEFSIIHEMPTGISIVGGEGELMLRIPLKPSLKCEIGAYGGHAQR